MSDVFIGIDVQSVRGCAVAVVGASGRLQDASWLETGDASIEAKARDLAERHPGATFGIDSPRMPIPAPRAWYWRKRSWGPRKDEQGWGRHCEVVVSAHKLANPQWTPLASQAKEWMQIGFRLFDTLAPLAPTHEVFPTASYRMLETDRDLRVDLSFAAFRPGPKDMLDATLAALTVREHAAGRGCEVGGGDGLGTIVLPRPLARPIEGVLAWPDSPAE